MSRVDGVVGERLLAVGFPSAASKLFAAQPGLVPRRKLVERIEAGGGDLLLVAAPAGYGKSTFLAELTREDQRETAWLSLSP